MRGQVFIAWNGKPDLANKIKKELEKEEYKCIVGGRDDNYVSSGFIGKDVIDQIDSSNQAIFVIQKKDDGTIGGNVMFELGYSLKKFKADRIHIFYIDIAENDLTIPSDIRGAWYDESDMKSDDENLVEKIVTKFNDWQNQIIPEKKMQVVDDYYDYKSIFLGYHKNVIWTEYELAQYVLFYALAAYLQNDDLKNAQEPLTALLKNLNSPRNELYCAIMLATGTLRFYSDIKNNRDKEMLFLDDDDYEKINGVFSVVESRFAPCKDDDFTNWFYAIVYNIKNYSTLLYTNSDELDEEEKTELLEKSVEYAEECLRYCSKLEKKPENEMFVEIYQAYMHRNIATAKISLGENAENIKSHLETSCELRSQIWINYSLQKNINSALLEKLEMEYHLSLSENIKYIPDLKDGKKARRNCGKYVEKIKSNNMEKTHFVSKIESNIKSNKDE